MDNQEILAYFKAQADRLIAFAKSPAPRSPATLLHDAMKDFERALEANPEKLRGQFAGLIQNATLPTKEKTLGSWLTDIRCQALLSLVEEAEARNPLIFVELAGEYMLNSTFMTSLTRVGELGHQAKTLSGEPQARTAVESCGEIAELLYKPYLKMVRALYKTVEEKPLTPAPSTVGALVKELVQNLPKGKPRRWDWLVDPAAGWLRNSAKHGNWRYLPDQDRLEMWDDHHPAEKISAIDLLERGGDWVSCSFTFTQGLWIDALGRHLPYIAKLGGVLNEGIHETPRTHPSLPPAADSKT